MMIMIYANHIWVSTHHLRHIHWCFSQQEEQGSSLQGSASVLGASNTAFKKHGSTKCLRKPVPSCRTGWTSNHLSSTWWGGFHRGQNLVPLPKGRPWLDYIEVLEPRVEARYFWVVWSWKTMTTGEGELPSRSTWVDSQCFDLRTAKITGKPHLHRENRYVFLENTHPVVHQSSETHVNEHCTLMPWTLIHGWVKSTDNPRVVVVEKSWNNK